MVGRLLVKAGFSLSTSNEKRSAFYRERRDTMLEALECHCRSENPVNSPLLKSDTER
jgi:hypothetical protein